MAIYIESKDGRLEAERGKVPPELRTLESQIPALAELARRGQPWEVAPEDLSRDFSLLSALAPECLVPILGRDGRLLGLLALGLRRSEEPYSREDKRLLASVASQASVALESIHLAEQMAERLEAERRAAFEMGIAKQVQSKLFPQKLPRLETLDYAGGCLQARQVGGDYFDFLDLGSGRMALLLADVAGKGISTALLMANLQANLRSQYALALKDLLRLLDSVNRLFYDSTPPNHYATVFIGVYEDASRRLRYVNCGHNPPILLRRGGEVERLTATATVLGMFAEWKCEPAEVRLTPDDCLLVFSDGATEAASDEGEEFGEARLVETLRALRTVPVPALLESIMTTIKQFTGREQEDDLTLVVARSR